MKLTIDLRMINASGIGTYLKNIVPGILDAFNDVTVLGNEEELSAFSWASRVKIIAFNENIYSIKEQLKYPQAVPVCDALWCPHFNAPLLPVKAKKIVVTIHDLYHLSEKNKLPIIQKLYAGLLYKNAARKASVIFTVSEFSKSELIKYTNASAQKIKVVYCGVNTEIFNPQASSEGLKMNLPEKYILYVGNVKPHKNLITLLKAYNALSDEIKSAYKLVIIGKETGFINTDASLTQYIEENNLHKNIVFTGYVEDKAIPVIYKQAELFVFPSLYEGFGLPVLEALAVHTPVISSNAASLPEVGGDAVEYFDPLDFNTLAVKITELLESPARRQELIANADTQASKYTWQKSISKHVDALKNI